MSLFSEEEIEKSIKRRKKATVPAWTELGAIGVLVALVLFAAYSALSGPDPSTTPVAVAPAVSDPGVPFFSETTDPEESVPLTTLPSTTVAVVTPPQAVWSSSGLELALDEPASSFLTKLAATNNADTTKPVAVTAYTPFVTWSFSIPLKDGTNLTVQATWSSVTSSWVQL